MLHKLLLASVFTLAMMISAQAQKVALVDINNILESLEDYQAAQNEIDQTSAKWRQEIAQEYDKIKSMYNKFQAEQVLLSSEVILEREEEIIAKEAEVRSLQKRRFGPERDLFRRRQELVSPIQDKVFTAIEDYAKIKGYDIVFDKAGSAGLIYVNDDYDKTKEIKRELGIR